MLLEEKPERSLDADHASESANEEDLREIRTVKYGWQTSGDGLPYVANGQQTLVEQQQHAEEQERDAEAGEADADL